MTRKSHAKLNGSEKLQAKKILTKKLQFTQKEITFGTQK